MKTTAPPIGIDLGTTFSVVAYLDATGLPRTIVNQEGDLTTPSVVLFDESSTTVGREARNAAPQEPELIAQFAKRDMGLPLYNRAIQGKSYPPEVIQSLILKKLKSDAEAALGCTVEEVVVTVPAYFNDPRRKATQDAGRLAGLYVRDIINEPTAAALTFGVQQGFLARGEARQEERILIYDLGGGTFDVSLMHIKDREFTVLATDGNFKLGGIDWDRKLADHIAEAYLARHGFDPRHDPVGMQRLLRDAEDAKRALTGRKEITATFEFREKGVRVPISRELFEELTANLLELSRFTTANLLACAGLKWRDLTRLLLVGGSTRMPMVAAMLERESGLKVDRCLSPDEAVAHGAAIYAGLLRTGEDPRQRTLKVTNVNSHSLGVLAVEKQTQRKRNRVMIAANTPLPASESARFETSRTGQKSIAINVIEGGDASGENSTLIGQCFIRDLPPDLPMGTIIDVKFSYQSNGRLNVEASVPTLRKETRLEIERASGMTEEDLRHWHEQLGTCAPVPHAIERPPERPPPPPEPAWKQLVRTAERLADERRFAESFEQAAKAVELSDGEAEAVLCAAQAAWNSDRSDICLEFAQQLFGSPDRHFRVEACLVMSQVYRKDSEIDQAVAVLQEAIESDETCCEAYGRLAQCLLDQGHRQQSLEMARQGLAVDPEHALCRAIIAELGPVDQASGS